MNTIESTTQQRDSSDPYAHKDQILPELRNEQIERVKLFGTVERLSQGYELFAYGDRTADFFVVLDGCIEIYEHTRKGMEMITKHCAKQFTGEIDLFNNRKILVTGRMGNEGSVIRVKREDFKRLITAEPDIGEVVMRAFILRRAGLVLHKQGSVTLLCMGKTADALRIEQFLRRNGYPVQVLDCLTDQCTHWLETYKVAKEELPAVLIHLNDRVIKNPSNYQLAAELGLEEPLVENHVYDVAIVGGGPAGLSAAVYAASEGLDAILLEKEAPGGQASTSSKIENYLGFPTGISGQALADRAQVQAMKFGAKIVLPYSVKKLDCQQNPFRLHLCSGATVQARAVIVTTGAQYRRLNVENSTSFDNAGVYYAATPMESEICAKEEIIVVGGGNSAGQAAVFLSGHAKHVHLFIRRDSLVDTMSEYLISRILASDKITLHTHTEITEIAGDKHLESVTWLNNQSGETMRKPIRHVFLMIGAVPQTQWLKGCVELDEKGFIRTGIDLHSVGEQRNDQPKPMMLETSKPGVFAAGDVRSGSIKRVASGVGEGSMAVSHVHQFLAGLVVK
ncbi:MAG: FAD-dependent oxidoreductase [Sumerlaeia bacterium]